MPNCPFSEEPAAYTYPHISISKEWDVPHDICLINLDSKYSQNYGFAKFFVLPEPR